MDKVSKANLIKAVLHGKISKEKAKQLLKLPDMPIFVDPDTNEKKLISLLVELGINHISVKIVHPNG
ncbi:MAG: hypothetical protein WD555_03675 [Fulvivirga sp.]